MPPHRLRHRLLLVVVAGIESEVGQAQIFAGAQAQDFGRGRGLFGPKLRRSSGGPLTGREVDDHHAMASVHRREDGAATEQLDVVGVGSEDDDVGRPGHSPTSTTSTSPGVQLCSRRVMRWSRPWRAK